MSAYWREADIANRDLYMLMPKRNIHSRTLYPVVELAERSINVASEPARASGSKRAAEFFKFANAKQRAIFTSVSGASRCWYAVMQAEEQNCMCQ